MAYATPFHSARSHLGRAFPKLRIRPARAGLRGYGRVSMYSLRFAAQKASVPGWITLHLIVVGMWSGFVTRHLEVG